MHVSIWISLFAPSLSKWINSNFSQFAASGQTWINKDVSNFAVHGQQFVEKSLIVTGSMIK